MEKESNLSVTFSRRRSGLFKKASELSILCGVEIAIVVFSPAKKAFSFGHPSVQMIIDRYLRENLPSSSNISLLMEAHQNAHTHGLSRQLTYMIIDRYLRENLPSSSNISLLMEAHQNAHTHGLSRQLTYVDSQLDIENNKSDVLRKIRKEGQDNRWWEAPIESLGLEELEQLNVQLGVLGKNIKEQKERSAVESANATAVVPIYSSTEKGSGYGLSKTPHGLVLGYGHYGN
nr:agamous-like MADS-box protein AGL62 [Tanacetum cinerariifolium]